METKGVKLRKPDGTARCRIMGRRYMQQVEDKDETFASTPSLTTLRLAFGFGMAHLDRRHLHCFSSGFGRWELLCHSAFGVLP